jgi:hypothetical protein
MAMIDCDWCDNEMRRIGAVETGFLVGHASVWLCHCGHEREVFDSGLPLEYWRNELVFALFVRACDVTHRTRDERWATIMADLEGARVLTQQLLARYR